MSKRVARHRVVTQAMEDEGYAMHHMDARAYVENTPHTQYVSRRELKFFDTALSFTVDNTAEIPATGQLTLVPQSDDQNGRIGRKILIHSISIHGFALLQPAAGALAADLMYMYLVLDTQANGAAATVASSNTGVFTGGNLNTNMPTLANEGRFRILHQWVLELQASAGVTTAYNNAIKSWSCYKKCRIPIEYDASAATGAITTIRSNNIFLIAGSAGQADDLIGVEGVCRLRFTDD